MKGGWCMSFEVLLLSPSRAAPQVEAFLVPNVDLTQQLAEALGADGPAEPLPATGRLVQVVLLVVGVVDLVQGHVRPSPRGDLEQLLRESRAV